MPLNKTYIYKESLYGNEIDMVNIKILFHAITAD